MRPIDADALADYLDDELLNECFSGEEISAEDAVRMALRKVLDAPTLDVAPGIHASWISVDDALPVMQTDGEKGFIVCNGKKVIFLLYERATVRGKTVCRWKYAWYKIYDGPKITHWMALPELPANAERS